MHNNTFDPTGARTYLQDLAYSNSKVKLRRVTFRENTDGTADKFVGVLTIEVRQPDLKRQVIAIRVYGARKTLQSSMKRHTAGESLHEIFSDITPGDAPPDTTPFRIGGMQVAYCAPTDLYIMAQEMLEDYSHSYMQTKSCRGYRLPNAAQGGSIGTFMRCANEEFETTGTQWKLGAQVVNNPTMVWGSFDQVQPQNWPKSLTDALADTAPPEPKKMMDVGSMFLSPRKRINITRTEPKN